MVKGKITRELNRQRRLTRWLMGVVIAVNGAFGGAMIALHHSDESARHSEVVELRKELHDLEDHLKAGDVQHVTVSGPGGLHEHPADTPRSVCLCVEKNTKALARCSIAPECNEDALAACQRAHPTSSCFEVME